MCSILCFIFLHESLNCSSYIIFSTINVFSDPVYTDGSFTYVRSAAGWKEVKLPTGLSSYLRTLFSKPSSSQIVWSNCTICWYLTWNWLNFCTYFIYFFEILTFKGRKMQFSKKIKKKFGLSARLPSASPASNRGWRILLW